MPHFPARDFANCWLIFTNHDSFTAGLRSKLYDNVRLPITILPLTKRVTTLPSTVPDTYLKVTRVQQRGFYVPPCLPPCLLRQWLHWLLVRYRIKFKLCCLVHATHYGRSLAYLTETVQSVGASRSRCGLRSSSTSSMDYSLPRLRTKFGERAFSHAGPATWNALPDHIRTAVLSTRT